VDIGLRHKTETTASQRTGGIADKLHGLWGANVCGVRRYVVVRVVLQLQPLLSGERIIAWVSALFVKGLGGGFGLPVRKVGAAHT
jgi:hypothetical protein